MKCLLLYVFQGDSKNDLWIFALAVLLSSTFVYNSMNTINNDDLEQLQYPGFTEKLMRMETKPDFPSLRLNCLCCRRGDPGQKRELIIFYKKNVGILHMYFIFLNQVLVM